MPNNKGLFAAVLMALAAAVPAVAQTASVTGTWKAEFVTPDRTYPARLDLKQDGDTLTGTLGADTDSPKVTGSVQGTNISFSFQTRNPNGGGDLLAIAVKGSIASDGLTGEFTVNDGPGGTFAAKRDTDSKTSPAKPADASKADAAAKQDVTGTWAATVDLGAIQASPTIAFKQDGETLTGQYTSQQYGQFPLKGTMKGNQIDFGFTMTIEGNTIEASFSGTVDKDSMKGTASYGGLADGTFTAARKK
jgi:hypothetical protein